MDLFALPLLLRTAGVCNRSPHSLQLLGLVLAILKALMSDAACRSHVANYLELCEVMIKVCHNHFGTGAFFSAAADCLLAAAEDPRLREQLASTRR